MNIHEYNRNIKKNCVRYRAIVLLYQQLVQIYMTLYSYQLRIKIVTNKKYFFLIIKLISLIILHVSQRILAECQNCIPRKLLYRDKSRYKTLHYDTRNASKLLLTLQIGNFLLTHIYIYTPCSIPPFFFDEREKEIKEGAEWGRAKG